MAWRKQQRLLILSYTFPPQLTPESILLTKLLRQMACSPRNPFAVSVICADEHTVIEPHDLDLARLLPGGIPVTRLPSPERNIFWRILTRLVPMLQFLPDKSLAWYLKNRGRIVSLAKRMRPTLLYSRSNYLGSHLLALLIKRALGIPWIVYFSDPWVGNPYLPRGFLSRWLNSRWERAVIANADRLVFVCTEMLEFTMRKYSPALGAKCVVIPHSYDPTLYPPQHHWPISLWKTVQFSYIGNFYGTRNPKPLLRALSLLRKNDPTLYAQLIIRIVGTLPANITRSVLFRTHLRQIIVAPTAAYLTSLREMSAADALLLIDADVKPNVFSPSKLFDYFGSGRPILGITPPNSPAAKILKAHNHIVVSPHSPERIYAELKNLAYAILRNRKHPLPIHVPPPQYATSHTAACFIKICRTLVQ